jgi:hypothetical protein
MQNHAVKKRDKAGGSPSTSRMVTSIENRNPEKGVSSQQAKGASSYQAMVTGTTAAVGGVGERALATTAKTG